MKKVIGYVRVSTAEQAEEGVSLEAQEAKARSWANLNDADEVIILRDEGISGKRSDNRPGLQAALAATGKGDALVVYSLSRLSRSTKDTLGIAEALAKRGADLVSISEKIDTTTAAGKMVFRMLAVLSEFERDQVSDRTCFALSHKRALSEKTGGDVPYGYRARMGKLSPHKKEQEAIRLILDLADQGDSLRAICGKLEDAGIARKKGSTSWHPQTVARIVSHAERDRKEKEAKMT